MSICTLDARDEPEPAPGHRRPYVNAPVARGGHAFCLRPTKLPIGRWPALVEQCLHSIGVLSPQEN